MKVIVFLSALLTVIGGLNWGLIGFFDFNAVEHFLCCPEAIQIVYCVIGLASIIVTMAVAGVFGDMCCCKSCSCSVKEVTEEKAEVAEKE